MLDFRDEFSMRSPHENTLQCFQNLPLKFLRFFA